MTSAPNAAASDMAQPKPADSSELERGAGEKTEKQQAAAQLPSTAIHEFTEAEGYVVDDDEGGGGYKLAKDGKTRLIPQPSDDPHDPLNWSWFKKNLTLFIVSWAAFMPDYGSATGAVALLAQAAYVRLPHLAYSPADGRAGAASGR